MELDANGRCNFFQIVRRYFLFFTASIAIGAVAFAVSRHDAVAVGLVGTLFVFAVTLLYLTVDLQKYRRAVSLRRPWLLLAATSLVRSIAFGVRSWGQAHLLVRHQSFSSSSDFTSYLLFIGGTFYMVLLATPVDAEYRPVFLLIDSLQIVLLWSIFQLKLLGTLPFFHPAQPPSSQLTEAIYGSCIRLGLVLVVLFRFLTAATWDEQRFFKVVGIAGFIGGLTLTIHDVQDARSQSHPIFYDSITLLVMFIIWVMYRELAPETLEGASARSRGRLGEILNIAAPSIVTMLVMGLGLDTAMRFRAFGFAVATLSLLLYVARTATTQWDLEQSRRSLREANDKLNALSLTDPLTGVANRRSFDVALSKEWDRCARTHDTLSLVLIDVDFFKRLNDSYGHQTGDECLVRVVHAIRTTAALRSIDVVARYGGEEFGVILPATDDRGAYQVAAACQTAVAALAIPNQTDLGPVVSISLGVATFHFPNSFNIHTAIEAADNALYRAKRNGRNRVECDSFPQKV